MNMSLKRFITIASIACIALLSSLLCQKSATGIFAGHGDIGKIHLNGSVSYDADRQEYLISGSGDNMWFTSDALYFVWKKASGDVTLAADIRWLGEGVNPHRKACLLIRQSLEPDSPYADAVVHGDGLTSLQYREVSGGPTREIQANVTAPQRLSIVKEGDLVYMEIAKDGQELQAAGGSFRIRFKEPFYIGLGVCAHDSTVLEKAVFSKVTIYKEKVKTGGESILQSTLETIAIASTDRRVVYNSFDLLQSPNWLKNGRELLYESNDQLYTIPVSGGEPQLVESATITGTSINHSLSPDGKNLVYSSERNGEQHIYSTRAAGDTEKQLTTGTGAHLDPEFSPDGKYIYFSSNRTGSWQIWRMLADGSNAQQLTIDEYNNRFPHPSPDGQWIVFLSAEKSRADFSEYADVMLKLLPANGGEVHPLAKLTGGPGTLDAPSWSPDSKNVAFVSYRFDNH